MTRWTVEPVTQDDGHGAGLAVFLVILTLCVVALAGGLIGDILR